MSSVYKVLSLGVNSSTHTFLHAQSEHELGTSNSECSSISLTFAGFAVPCSGFPRVRQGRRATDMEGQRAERRPCGWEVGVSYVIRDVITVVYQEYLSLTRCYCLSVRWSTPTTRMHTHDQPPWSVPSTNCRTPPTPTPQSHRVQNYNNRAF